MASAHHGIPRATNDIDILVDLQISHLPTLLRTLRPEFYLDDQADIGRFINSQVQTLDGVKDTVTIIAYKAFT